MKKSTFGALALALSFSLSPLALAQTSSTGTTGTSDTQVQSTVPSTDQSTTTGQTNTVTGTDSSKTTTDPNSSTGMTTGQTGTSTDTTTTTTSTDTTTIVAPSDQTTATSLPAGSHLASKIIGTSVYSNANENIGDVNDIVLAADGKVESVVIGVGGFLGMGERNVAIAMSRLRFEPGQDGGAERIVVDTTAEELKTMPVFDGDRT